MVSLNSLNDQQNHLLTQLSYQSHRLSEYEGLTLSQIYGSLKTSDKESAFGERLKEMIDADLGVLVIKDTGNDSETGFGAVAFTDHDGNTGISFRGTDGLPSTESANDWLDNVTSMISGTSVQSAQAETFYDKNKNAEGHNYLYGHSKGGQLSESVYVNNYDEIQVVHVLNPQPLNPYSLTPEQISAMQSRKMDIVIVEGDYVWFLGTLPSYGNIRVVENTGGTAGSAHTFSSLRYTNGEINPGQMPLWEYIAYFGISSLTIGIQIGGSTVGFAYNCVVRVIDFAKEDMWPEIKSFIDATSHWVAEKYREIEDVAVQLSSFLTTIASGANEWLSRNFNSGYRAASNEPTIKVDTAKLRGYAERLGKVNQRLTTLDGRMDDLYFKVGLRDLFNLIHADLWTGSNWRITNCAKYLNETANDFEGTERNVVGQFQG